MTENTDTAGPGHALMVKQGYIPQTCTLPEPLVFGLVMHEENNGRRACWGCNHDRLECKGEPNRSY